MELPVYQEDSTLDKMKESHAINAEAGRDNHA